MFALVFFCVAEVAPVEAKGANLESWTFLRTWQKSQSSVQLCHKSSCLRDTHMHESVIV